VKKKLVSMGQGAKRAARRGRQDGATLCVVDRCWTYHSPTAALC
jgi:hypothetical protein